MILYGNGREDDSQAIRALLRGEPVLDARLEVEIEAPTLRDLVLDKAIHSSLYPR
jgi:hypothetical protein